MKNTLSKRNENLIDVLFIMILLFIFLYDYRVEFLNGVQLGIKDFIK